MATGGMRITADGVPALLKAIEDLTHQQVLVGIPGDTAPRADTGASNALIGFVQEFGSPAKNIPARPFLRPGVEQAIPQIVSRLRTGAKRAISAPVDPEAGTNALIAAGLTAQNSVRRYMNAGVPPPLAAATLRARRSRGHTSQKSLVETGQLRNAITFVIKPVR